MSILSIGPTISRTLIAVLTLCREQISTLMGLGPFTLQ